MALTNQNVSRGGFYDKGSRNPCNFRERELKEVGLFVLEERRFEKN